MIADITARERNRIIACFMGLAVLWLFAASRLYINTSWSDDAWGYVLLPLGTPAIGDRVLFKPPLAVDAEVPYLKTVRGLPGAQVSVNGDRMVSVDGTVLGRKPRPMPSTAERSKPWRLGSCPMATIICTPITSTAMIAVTPRSAWCRASAFSGGPSRCRICPGSVSKVRW